MPNLPGFQTGYRIGRWIADNLVSERFVVWYGKRKGLL